MDQHCAFKNQIDQGCYNNIIPGESVCTDHLHLKCTVCGNQAVESCGRRGELNCWISLCGTRSCHLLHLYISHPNLIMEISELENELRVEPVKILVGRINRQEISSSEIYKAGFLIPYQTGGFIWTTICVQSLMSDIEDVLNDKLKDTNDREVIYTESFYNSKIPPGTFEELIS